MAFLHSISQVFLAKSAKVIHFSIAHYAHVAIINIG